MFHDRSTTAIYTLSLHDALPIFGQPFMYPKNDLSYTANFMRMMFGVPTEEYKPNPVLVRALDRIFILHADHRSEEHTSELQSQSNLVCRLLLERKNTSDPLPHRR